MEQVLQALNRLVRDGVVETYAIGGAIGASLYIDAHQTEDVDAFVFFPENETGLLSLAPIYAALEAYGGVLEREHVRFGAWPLQILPDATPLVGEAIREARSVEFAAIPTRVFRAEHLCAIALQTGRSKDIYRVRAFLEAAKVDRSLLRALAVRFDLQAKLDKVEDDIDARN